MYALVRKLERSNGVHIFLKISDGHQSVRQRWASLPLASGLSQLDFGNWSQIGSGWETSETSQITRQCSADFWWIANNALWCWSPGVGLIAWCMSGGYKVNDLVEYYSVSHGDSRPENVATTNYRTLISLISLHIKSVSSHKNRTWGLATSDHCQDGHWRSHHHWLEARLSGLGLSGNEWTGWTGNSLMQKTAWREREREQHTNKSEEKFGIIPARPNTWISKEAWHKGFF